MGRGEAQDRKTFRVERLGDVDSTNAEALRRAAAGERGPLWIIAERQLAGRGRRGRPWVSNAGNLYASVLFEPRCRLQHAGQIAFVAGLALHDAICGIAPVACDSLKLKWPNDLLLKGAKVSGILIENAGGPDLDLVVVGFGVNCTTHPPDTPYAATDFAKQGIGLSSAALGDALAECFEGRLRQWRGGDNFAEIRGAWLRQASGIGGAVVIRFADSEVEGVFEDLGHDGRLVLRLPGGGHRDILAGDVFFAASRTPTTDRTT